MSFIELGYLERPYLNDPYMSGYVEFSINEQVELKIDSSKAIREQTNLQTSGSKLTYEQVNQQTSGVKLILEQASLVLSGTDTIHEQVNRDTSTTKLINEQTNRFLDNGSKLLREEINRGEFLHAQCGGYLEYAYLSEPYLGPKFCVSIPEQVSRKTTVENEINEQVSRQITTVKTIREQIQRQITLAKVYHEQVTRVQTTAILEQITIALYNTTNLRVLCDFPSRGTNGLNWTASSTAAGDYSVNNLNTDIVEQIWKSNGVVSGLTLTCDTGVTQGIFMDTLAILNHNMTTSASVIFQGSNDAGFSSIGFSQTLISKLNNIFYIEPTLPTASYRYWRLLISDPTNTSSSIFIGTVVFGSAIVMQQTCITQSVSKATKHFSDKVATEGFTNVSNDRAIKYAVGMEMRNLSYNRGDYTRLRGIFDTARTSLKCLWIPTPQFADRFATFAKLSSIPVEQHNVISADADYITFSIEVDESL
jgi:hypothetical protein